MWLSIFKHLLPRGKAWCITTSKNLRRFFDGLSQGIGPTFKSFFDGVWLDIFPSTTRQLEEWEDQWGLIRTGLTEQQRRDRLSATWKALGGQDPQYIQDILQANGFNVYVHEWWVPGTEPTIGSNECAQPRSPILYLRREFTNSTSGVECDEPLALCGEDFALAGNGVEPRGYPLVNRTFRTEQDTIPLCGEEIALAGEDQVLCGNYEQFRTDFQNYIVPMDPDKWPYFLYIGAEDINDIAQVDPNRREEFETLCLKICPAQQWLGILVEYV